MDVDRDRGLAALMTRAQDGDRGAYQALLVEVRALVTAFVRRRVRHADQVEDIVQETLLSIHRHRHTYDPARPFAGWMYAIAKHRLIDVVGRARRRDRNEVGGLDEASLRVPSAEPGALSVALRRALALLSAPQREIIHMLKFEGYSVAEIAGKTGRSPSSVKITAHRGYRKLRALIAGVAR